MADNGARQTHANAKECLAAFMMRPQRALLLSCHIIVFENIQIARLAYQCVASVKLLSMCDKGGDSCPAIVLQTSALAEARKSARTAFELVA